MELKNLDNVFRILGFSIVFQIRVRSCRSIIIFYFSIVFQQTQGPICPHCIVALPNSNGMQLLLCYDNEGVYVNTYGRVSKTMVLQWGEMPTSVAYIGTGQIMGWGNKAIEIRSVESGHLDGVFMHKKAQRLKFLCERNDKVQTFSFVVIFIFPWIFGRKTNFKEKLIPFITF